MEQRTIEATTKHHVPAMICLEYLPTPRSKKWRVSFRMHVQGRANMESQAKELAAENGWGDWRIVEEKIVPPSFNCELTEAGEQMVIPGCERTIQHQRQGSLWA